jgi:DNA-binding CsgD family transcriptional regulator
LHSGPAAPVVVVHGEAGVGKTRTAMEIAGAMRERGARVLWGSGYEGATPPYGLWLEAIGRHVEALDPEPLRSLLGDDAAILAELVPAIRHVLPDVGQAASLGGEEGRLRLYAAVVRLLDALEGTTLVVLDDLQWADAGSLGLFVHVARVARPSLLVTYRGAELDLIHPVAPSLGEVQRWRGCEYLTLARLDRREAAELLERVAGRRLEPDVTAAVYAESAGNPFFLVELGRYLRRHAELGVDEAGRWRVPQTVLGAIGLRVAPLSAETRRVLELAAVFNGAFAFAELQAVSELGEEELLGCVEEALSAELLRAVGEERYDFAHQLVRQALYARLSPSRGARLHRRVAEALERVHEGGEEQVAAELARQYAASATLPGAGRGVEHALTAARLARLAHAPADAVELLRLALELVAAEDVAGRARVLEACALAQADALMLPDALETLEAAVSLIEESGADAVRIGDLLYEAVSMLAVPLTIYPTALIARGLARLSEQDGLAWARLKLLERAGAPNARPWRWLNLDPTAVRIARTLGTERDIARTIDPSEPWERADLEQHLDRVRGFRDPSARLRGLEMIALRTALFAPDGSPAAERTCEELRRLADEVASPIGRAVAGVAGGALLGARGELDAAIDQFDRARALTEGWSSITWLPAYAVFVAELTRTLVRPDWPRTADVAWSIATAADLLVWDRISYAAFASHAFARAGQRGRARQILDDVIGNFRSTEPFDIYLAQVLSLATDTVWELRDAETAAVLLPWARAVLENGLVDQYLTCTELTIGRLCTVADRFDEAADAFARARGVVERRGQRPLRAIVDHDEAIARLWRNQPGAAPLMAAAKTAFEGMGMIEWARRAALHEPAEPELPDGITPREAEILRLLAAGKSNRQIATELVLSVHTVERHVHNAYRKIDARNRADATAYAMRMLV